MKCYICGDTGRISSGEGGGKPCPQCAVLRDIAAGVSAGLDVARAEVARLGAELRAARFVASGQAGDHPAEYVVRRNGQLLAALRAIVEACDPDGKHESAGDALGAIEDIAKRALNTHVAPAPVPSKSQEECAHLRHFSRLVEGVFTTTCLDCGAPQ